MLTKDSVTIAVDAVVFYKINDPRLSILNVEHVSISTQLLSQTTLRNVMGTKSLTEVLGEREAISNHMQVTWCI